MPDPVLVKSNGSTFFSPSGMSVAFTSGSAAAGNGLLLVHAYVEADAVNVPSGYQLLNSPDISQGDKRISIFGKIAVGGETGVTVTSPTGNFSGGMAIMEFSDVASDFIATKVSIDRDSTNTSSLNITGLTLDPTYTESVLFVGGALTTSARTITQTGFTSVWQASRLAVGYKVATDPGSTTYTPTWTPGIHGVGFLLAVRGTPAPVATDLRVGFKRSGAIVYGTPSFKRTDLLPYPGSEVFPSSVLYPG